MLKGFFVQDRDNVPEAILVGGERGRLEAEVGQKRTNVFAVAGELLWIRNFLGRGAGCGLWSEGDGKGSGAGFIALATGVC